jgi:AraC-like DNA-binding protein
MRDTKPRKEITIYDIAQEAKVSPATVSRVLTNSAHVSYKGVLYDITCVDTFEGYKENLTLYCKKKA